MFRQLARSNHSRVTSYQLSGALSFSSCSLEQSSWGRTAVTSSQSCSPHRPSTSSTRTTAGRHHSRTHFRNRECLTPTPTPFLRPVASAPMHLGPSLSSLALCTLSPSSSERRYRSGTERTTTTPIHTTRHPLPLGIFEYSQTHQWHALAAGWPTSIAPSAPFCLVARVLCVLSPDSLDRITSVSLVAAFRS